MTIVSGQSVTTADGRRVRTMQCGDLDGTPVLTFHPSPASRLFVRVHAAEALRTGVRLVGFSRPGYGGSTPAFPPSLGLVADDAAAVADHYGIGRFAALGVSGGTPFAAATAARLGDRVTALGLCSALAPWRELDEPGILLPEEQALLELARTGAVEDSVEGFRRLGEQEFGPLLAGDDEAIARAFRAGVPPPDNGLLDLVHAMGIAVTLRDALEDDDEQPCFEGHAFDMVATGCPWDIPPDGVTAPTWIWQGQLDRVTPRSHADWYAARIPQAKVTGLPGGHLSPFAGNSEAVFRTLAQAAEDQA